MISLRTVDAEYTGVGGAWTDVAKALCDAGYLSASAQLRIKSLEQFGSLINKTDMHLGSLSLSIDGDRFSLLPAYDMCSMGFSPKGAEVADLQRPLHQLPYPAQKHRALNHSFPHKSDHQQNPGSSKQHYLCFHEH